MTSESHGGASFGGSIPEAYHAHLGPFLFEFPARDLARRAAEMTDGAPRVLEVACGTGIATRRLAEALPAGSEIVATDLNPAMLAHAERVNGDLPGVTWGEADAQDLPFGDEEFDAVVCQFGLMFLPDRAKGLAEMRRVLKPGGPFLTNVWESQEANPSVKVVADAIKSFFDTDPPGFLDVPFGLSDRDEAVALIGGAGFDEIETHDVAEAVLVEDHDGPARGLVAGNPTILEIEERASVDAEEVIAAARGALERAFGPAPQRLELREIVYAARRPG